MQLLFLLVLPVYQGMQRSSSSPSVRASASSQTGQPAQASYVQRMRRSVSGANLEGEFVPQEFIDRRPRWLRDPDSQVNLGNPREEEERERQNAREKERDEESEVKEKLKKEKRAMKKAEEAARKFRKNHKLEGQEYISIQVAYPSSLYFGGTGSSAPPSNHLCCFNTKLGVRREEDGGKLHGHCEVNRPLLSSSKIINRYNEVRIPLSDQFNVEGYEINQSEIYLDLTTSPVGINPEQSQVRVVPTNPRSQRKLESGIVPKMVLEGRDVPHSGFIRTALLSWHPAEKGVLGILEVKTDGAVSELVRPWTRLRLKEWTTIPEGYELKIGLAKLRLATARHIRESSDAIVDYYVNLQKNDKSPVEKDSCLICQNDDYPAWNPGVAHYGDKLCHLACLQSYVVSRKAAVGRDIKDEDPANHRLEKFTKGEKQNQGGPPLNGVQTVHELRSAFGDAWYSRPVDSGKFGQMRPVMNQIHRMDREVIRPPARGSPFVLNFDFMWRDRLDWLNTLTSRNDGPGCGLMGDLWIDDGDSACLKRFNGKVKKFTEEEMDEMSEDIHGMKERNQRILESHEEVNALQKQQIAAIQKHQADVMKATGPERLALMQKGPPRIEGLKEKAAALEDVILPDPDFDTGLLEIPHSTLVQEDHGSGAEKGGVYWGQVDPELQLPIIRAPFVVFERRRKQHKGVTGDDWGSREEVRDVVVLPINIGEVYTIGRASDNHIVLDNDDTTSLHSAELRMLDDGTVQVRDVQSSFGLLIRPQKGERDLHEKPQWLMHGGQESIFAEHSVKVDRSNPRQRVQMKGYVFDIEYHEG